jgi:DinB superfamily
MDADTRKKLIDTYKDGYRAIAEALTGATDEELDARPAPGKWSAREVVHHLADSEMTAAIRLRMLLAVDRPQLVGFDQDEFARRLFYDRPTEASLEAFKAARRTTADIMERMSEADWKREGTHTEHGRYTIERWLEIYGAHAHKHAEQIKVARDSARKKTA